MEPAVEERLPWQKITISVEWGWPITPILAVSIITHAFLIMQLSLYSMHECMYFKITESCFTVLLGRALRFVPCIVATMLQESSATGYLSGVCMSACLSLSLSFSMTIAVF